MRLKIILTIGIALATSVTCDIVVNTTSGQLRGYRERSGFVHTFYSFKGVPYAEPPIGESRFKAPTPHRGWSDVRNANQHGKGCPTNGFLGFLAGGNEDCLFLNVYTPDVNGSRGVMVWLHGGGYLLGDGNALLYGPDTLMRENIVVVTLNNRLGALGFLSTGDKYAQGNYGLKDVVLALQWIQNNIASFGGDPRKITLAGQSAGSCTITFLLLSRMADNLFQQAILMSGNALMPSLFQEHPRMKAQELASRLKINTNSTQSLIEKLRGVHFKDILKHEKDIFQQDDPLGLRSFDFVPSVESSDSTEERLLLDTPINLLLSKKFRTVPIMIGNTNREGLFNVRQFNLEPSIVAKYNENLDYFVPSSFNIFDDPSKVKEVADVMRNIYFHGENMTSDDKDEFANFQTDAGYKFSNDRFVKLFAQKSTDPIYYYQFSFDGALNFIKTFLFLKGYKGAAHADDIFYLFKPGFPELVFPSNYAFEVRKRNVRMWANFVKTGNPTPKIDDVVSVLWPQYTISDEEFLDIGHNLTVQSRFEKLKIFHDLQKKYTGHT